MKKHKLNKTFLSSLCAQHNYLHLNSQTTSMYVLEQQKETVTIINVRNIKPNHQSSLIQSGKGISSTKPLT